jgi:hypothetical protein
VDKISKKEYLKGEKKDKALDIIRYGLAIRSTNEEMLELLNNKGFPIAERTLRRYKSELYEESGRSAFNVFQKRTGEKMLDDLVGFEEMERECWQVYKSCTNNNEKLRTISMLRLVKAEKFRILKSYPQDQGRSTSTKDFPRMPHVLFDPFSEQSYSPNI